MFHLLAFVYFLNGSLSAQVTSSQLQGQITDPSGAAVAGSVITVANVDSGIRRVTAANELGHYSVPLLQPGNYQILVEAGGFRPVTRSGIVLQVAQVARVDFTLEIGTVSESILVTAAATLLDQQTSSLGQVIDNSKIVNIPLNGRSPIRLVQLTPGILTAPSSNGQFGDVAVNTMDESIISIGGGRAKTNEVLIDGIPSTTGFANQITTIPTVDSTQEFRVQSSNLSAEFGRFGGGVINVSTRAGTNDFHGSLFEFLRNSSLDSNEFFNKRSGRDRPPFRMNQYGFAGGGPILVPRLYSGKNRTFFFVDYQGTRWRRGDIFIATLPTELERRGDYTQSLNNQRQRILIFDPTTTRPDPARPGQFLRDAFPGNVIPQARMDPVALRMAAFFPAANAEGDPVTRVNNFVSNAPRGIDQAQSGYRVDHQVNQAYRVFGRFAFNRSTLAQPDYFGNVATSGPGANGLLRLYNYTGAFDNAITLSPSSILNIRYGYARFIWDRPTRSFGFDQRQLGLPDSLVSQISVPLYPIVNIEGYASQGGSSLLDTGQDAHSLLASFSKLAGRHNWKAGADLRLRRLNFQTLAQGGGLYSFTRAMTRGPDPNVVNLLAGIGHASFLLGAATSGNINIAAGNSLQNYYLAGYIQDDIQLSRKLTLNLGLRYETETPYTERRNQLNWFDAGIASPARNPAFSNLTGGLRFAGSDNRRVYDWDRNNISPRFGLAYTVFPKTVFRTGAGLFYSGLSITNSDTGFSPSTGFSSTTPMVASLDGLTPFRYLRNPYPDNLVQPTRDGLGAATFLGQGLNVWDVTARTPHNWQWNADIQHTLPGQFLLDLAYAGNRGVKLTQPREWNALDPSFLALGTGTQTLVDNPFRGQVSAGPLAQARVQRRQLLLPYPQFTSVNMVNSPSGNSSYHSFAIKLEKRYAQGVSFLVSYTVAKFIADVRNSTTTNDNNQNVGLNPSVQNWYDLRSERSISEFDIAQALAVSYVVELPFGPGKALLGNSPRWMGYIVGGWQWSGVTIYRGGYPLTLNAPVPGGGNRPNSVGRSARIAGGRSRSNEVEGWFDINAFTLPAPFTFGNVSRTLPDVRSPAFTNFDMALGKQFPLRERVALLLRFESFNLANTPHFWLPGLTAGSLLFGKINATTGLPRVNQATLKLSF